jgi:hypothetical protein
MKINSLRNITQTFALAVSLLGLFNLSGHAQRRDHLTEQEADQVREEQEIDRRIDVFIKAADRRLLVLANPDAVQTKKDEEKWGPLPKGTVAELLQDYKNILDEAEEKLDDAYTRLHKNPIVVKALAHIKDAAKRQLDQLRSLKTKVSTQKEEIALAEAIEEAENVTKGEAALKIHSDHWQH